MADTSLIIGNGNWAVKETSLLGYNIIQSKYVPIEMTVSRNTTATRVNSAGLIEVVPRNLLTYSQQIDNADWLKSGTPTITTNIAVAPDGTTTADGIKADDAVSFKNISQTKTVTANSTVTTSVFVKKETSETNFGGFNIYFTGGTPKICYGIVNAVNGTITIVSSTITPITSVVSFGDYWRISATTTDDGSNTSLQYSYYGTLSTNGTNIVQAVGSVRTVWGFQLEQGTTATEYFPTTDRFNIPRVDYSTGTASLLVEPARTNLVLRSEEFDNVSWEKSATGINTSIGTSGIESNVANAPSGTLTADRVNFNPQIDLDLGLKQVYAAAVATQSFVSSIYVKGEGSNIGKQIRLRIKRSIGGSYVAVDTTITLTSDWVRITSSALTLLASNTGVQYIISSNDATNALIWGAQLEQGSTATSYIPTTTIALARNADVISKTGISSLIGQTEGTLYAEINITTFNNGVFFSINDGTSANRIQMYKFTDNKIYCDRISATQSVTTSINSSALSVGTYKVAFAYQSGNSYLYINGAQVGATSDATFTFGSIGKVNIGSRFDDTSTFNDRIKSAILFPTRLTPGQLATLTT